MRTIAMTGMAAPLMAMAFIGDAAASLASLFPTIVIREDEARTEWPFAVPIGELTCFAWGENRHVFFSEREEDKKMAEASLADERRVVVSSNPMALLASIEDRSLYGAFDSLETLITRLAPYETIGRTLCDMPKPEK